MSFGDFFKTIGTLLGAVFNNPTYEGILGNAMIDTPWGNYWSADADRKLTQEEEQKTREWNKYLLDIQNEFSATEAQKQRDFEERMSNTAIQREVSDLNNAGLNPWLAAGGGASTPGGAAATSTTATGGKRVNINMFMTAARQNHQVAKDVANTIANFMHQ